MCFKVLQSSVVQFLSPRECFIPSCPLWNLRGLSGHYSCVVLRVLNAMKRAEGGFRNEFMSGNNSIRYKQSRNS